MTFEQTGLEGCVIIHDERHGDERGWFTRVFDAALFAKSGFKTRIDHTAEAYNAHRFTLRGMHCQTDYFKDAKLVRCVSGSAFDVAVDIRPASPTFGRWAATRLTAADHRSFMIPEGFAHGYLTLEDHTTLTYHLFTPYQEAFQRGFRFDDPKIGIQWPAAPEFISQRDQKLPSFAKFVKQERLDQ